MLHYRLNLKTYYTYFLLFQCLQFYAQTVRNALFEPKMLKRWSQTVSWFSHCLSPHFYSNSEAEPHCLRHGNLLSLCSNDELKLTVWELCNSLFEPSFLLKQWGRISLFEAWKFVKSVCSNDELKLTVWEICIALTEINSGPFFCYLATFHQKTLLFI